MPSDNTKQRIQTNKAVEFTYSISDDEGNVVEQVDIPINYVHGASNMGLIERVELALEGSTVGDNVIIDVPPAEGFGEIDPDLTFTDDLENVPPQFRHVGAQVEMTNDAGETKAFFVSSIEDDKLTLDGNHPLAGKTARFSINILEVRDATDDEIRHGISNPGASIH